MIEELSPARRFALRLIGSSDRDAAGSADLPRQHRAAQCLWDELARWTGPDGCHALISRAVAIAQSQHPELGLRSVMPPRSRDWLSEIAGQDSPGHSQFTGRMLEDIYVALFELLFRLVGEPIAMNLMTPCLISAPQGTDASNGKEPEND